MKKLMLLLMLFILPMTAYEKQPQVVHRNWNDVIYDQIIADIKAINTRTLWKECKKDRVAIIEAMMPCFYYMERKFSVPAEVTAIFFASETGYGHSHAFKAYHNPGGVQDRTYNNRIYPDLLSALDDWGRVLTSKRYTNYLNPDMKYNTVKDWITAYCRGGYWTCPQGLKLRFNVYADMKQHKIFNHKQYSITSNSYVYERS